MSILIIQGMVLLVVMLLFAVSAGAVRADDTNVESRPEKTLRPLSTDRPDKTESPYTVDVGHLQFETDLVSVAGTDIGDYHWREGLVLGLNCKIGLTNRIDLQLVVPTFSGESEWTDGRGDIDEKSKFPDLSMFESATIRCKVNLLGNDTQGPALALMPYMEFGATTSTKGNYAAGIIAPVAFSLNDAFSLSGMLVLEQASEEDVETQAIQLSSSLGHDLSSAWGGYVELFSEFREGIKPSITFDTGFTFGLSSDIQLDFGLNLGLTDVAADYNPFVGLSVRI